MDKVRAKRMAAELKGELVGGWLVGDYLGNGASAVVLSAQREDQWAALKVIDPELEERFGADQQTARIQRERELIGHTCPYLVKIFDGGRCDTTGHLYVAMELLVHPPLTALISSFPPERVGPIIEQVSKAAEFLETRDLAHRDIKPDNIVLSNDYEGAVLLDLGVVCPIGGDAAKDAGTGYAFLGTTRYSPPEYVMREEEESPVGWRAVTFYQLGAVLHDMIMRRRMYDSINGPPAKIVDAVRNVRPVIDIPT
jgi:serine/threonine protein kinase